MYQASAIQPDISEDDAPEHSSDSRYLAVCHSVNIRLSIPLLFRRCYLTILLGQERRSAARLGKERKKHPLVTRGNVAALLLFGTLTGMALLALIQGIAAFIFQQSDILVLPQ